MGQRQQSGVKLLYDPIYPMIIGNGPSVVLCHVTDLSVDKGRSGWRFTQREPFDELSQFGGQSVRLSSVPASVPGEPGQTRAPVLGQPELQGPQRDIMMASHMGQRHPVFDAGLEQAIALQGS